MKIFLYTTFALACFAFNSIFCRLALGADEADAASFTLIRLDFRRDYAAFNQRLFQQNRARRRGNWLSAFFLFAYAFVFRLLISI